MASKDWNDGRSDASSGKGASNQQNKPWQTR